MARKRKGTRTRNFVAIPFNEEVALGALADDTVGSDAILASLVEDLYVISIDAQCAWGGHSIGEGPLQVGYSHGDYTVAEIEECLDANVVDPDDKIANEHSRRLVRRLGTFSGVATDEVLNDGKKIRTKLKFTIGDGKNLQFWYYNQSGAPLTTGSFLRLHGTIYGKWLR